MNPELIFRPSMEATEKTEKQKTPLEVLFSGVTNNYTAKDIFQSDDGKRYMAQ